ncbi:MAG: carbohydrate ABC transporter permease, partial [Promethearchaeota archaeon]
VFRDKEIRSMTWHAANLWRIDQEYGLASTVSIMLFLFIIAFAFFIFSISKREKKKPQVKERKALFPKIHKKKENPIELPVNDVKIDAESDLAFSLGFETQVKQFSESQLTWIRIKLISKKGLFIFSVILMCLFCAAPFIWIILRSFRDPFIPQTQFEYSNITMAIMLIFFILALYFIVSKSKEVLFAISVILISLACAAPFIWIIISSAQYSFAPKIVLGYSYVILVIILILVIISFYFIILKKETTKKKQINPPNFKKKDYESTVLPSSDIEIESESQVKKLSVIDILWRFPLKGIRTLLRNKLVLFGISVILILFIIIAIYSWASSELISLRAFQVVFETSEFTGVSFDRALINGFILSGLTVVVVIVIGSLIAYALAKFDFSGKFWITAFIFSMTSLPPIMIVIPYFIQTATISDFFSANRILFSYLIIILGIIIFLLNIAFFIRSKKYKKKLFIITSIIIPILFYIIFRFIYDDSTDLRNNLYGLVLPYSALNLPLAVFVLQAFFREIPEDLWKAAKVDGASNFQIFRKVILPLTMPGIFTCAILIFIASWNELLLANIWLVSDVNHTVPRALLRFVQNDQSLTADWDTDIALMAATSVATIPLVILVLIFQKKIISGITRGAVKG